MIGNISPTQLNSPVVYVAARQGATAAAAAPASPPLREDTVQLSDKAQLALKSSKPAAVQPVASPSLGELIKEAANGNIRALARLAVVG